MWAGLRRKISGIWHLNKESGWNFQRADCRNEAKETELEVISPSFANIILGVPLSEPQCSHLYDWGVVVMNSRIPFNSNILWMCLMIACREILIAFKIKMEEMPRSIKKGNLGKTKSHFACFTIFLWSQYLKYKRAYIWEACLYSWTPQCLPQA